MYKPTISTGAAYADLDNDGDLDMIINNSNDPAGIFENNSNTLSKNHFLKIRLRGEGQNKFGIGAKVIITTDSVEQMNELYTTHGYQSSMEPLLHFGLRSQALVKTIKVTWPDGKISIQNNTRADKTLTIAYATSQATVAGVSTNPNVLFSDYTLVSGLNYQHQENKSYVDFKTQFLLPHQVSKQGPFLTKGDVNGDGLEDVFVGGSLNNPGQLYLQSNEAKFVVAASQPWAQEKTAKDAGVVLFDADGDKDLDLVISKSGTEFPVNDLKYQAVLYLNSGKGNFTKTTNALPVLTASSSCVAAADYDKDGDDDLFIGGHSIPGKYPLPPTSYLLRNETKNGAVKFEYASEQPEKLLRQPGMVTTAVWTDINKDSWPDLIVAGEYMPITFFENKQGKLINETAKYGLSETSGMWCKIISEDMDGDGDIDIVAGNMGLNTQFKASATEPVGICYSDFDNNGSIAPLLCYYIQGKNYPYASLDELAEQIPMMRKKFLRYENYSNATFDQLFTPGQMKKAITLKAVQLASCYFENRNGKFIMHQLPIEAQFSAIMGIIAGDWNKDDKKDLLISGNYYPWRVQFGRMDAGKGWLLQGDGKGAFKVLYSQQSGFNVPGDVRDMLTVSSGQGPLFIASRNNDHISVIKKN